MSDADLGRLAKSTAEISQHLKALVNIQKTFNENFVEFTKIFRAWLDQENPEIDLHAFAAFRPNQIVLVAGTDQYGKVTVVGVQDDNGNPKIEVEHNGTGEKILYDPGQLLIEVKD